MNHKFASQYTHEDIVHLVSFIVQCRECRTAHWQGEDCIFCEEMRLKQRMIEYKGKTRVMKLKEETEERKKLGLVRPRKQGDRWCQTCGKVKVTNNSSFYCGDICRKLEETVTIVPGKGRVFSKTREQVIEWLRGKKRIKEYYEGVSNISRRTYNQVV